MLTELQERIARAVLGADLSPDLALAGGGALISLGLVVRTTVDLDFFMTESRVDSVARQVVTILERDGLACDPVTSGPTFARLVASDGTDRCQVDVAQDARLWPTQRSELGPTVSQDELAADKMLALFSRAEARDYVDVYALAGRLGKARLLDLAREKDRGFDERVFADLLGGIARLEREEFTVDDATLDRIRAFVDEWRTQLRR